MAGDSKDYIPGHVLRVETMTMIRAVIFDMDGLMFDTERLAKQAWLEVGKKLGYPMEEHVISKIRGATPAARARVFSEETNSGW